jgi:hypothetical protein
MAQVLLPRLAQAEQIVAFARRPERGLMLHIVLSQHAYFQNRYSPPPASLEEAEQRMARILAEDPALAALIT